MARLAVMTGGRLGDSGEEEKEGERKCLIIMEQPGDYSQVAVRMRCRMFMPQAPSGIDRAATGQHVMWTLCCFLVPTSYSILLVKLYLYVYTHTI